jgi:hypothetical protein
MIRIIARPLSEVICFIYDMDGILENLRYVLRLTLMKLGLFFFIQEPGMERRGFLHFGGGLTPNSQDARKLLERSTLLINRQRVMMAADTVMPINS